MKKQKRYPGQIIKQALFDCMLLCLVVFFIPVSIISQSSARGFEHISLEQGLFYPGAYCILQDRAGFLWFSTGYGIDRYDGYSFVRFRDKAKLTGTKTLLEDKLGNIWAGTSYGLCMIEPSTGKITSYQLHPSDPGNELSNNVLSIYEDKQGILWVGTFDGLNKFDRAAKTFTRLRHSDKDPGSLIHNAVNCIYEDKSGSLWLGTGSGLEKYDPATGKFIHFWHDPDTLHNFIIRWNSSKYWIQAIYEDRSGNLWLATSGGLVEFNRKNNSFLLYTNEPLNPSSLSNKYVNAISEDDSGLLWVGTQNGLNTFDRKTGRFTRYYHDQLNPASLSHNTVNSIFRERSGTLWLATDAGLDKLTLVKPQFKSYKLDFKISQGGKSSEIFTLVRGRPGKILVYSSNGWYVFDRKSETMTPYLLPSSVSRIFHDKAGNLWFCEDKEDKGGLYMQDPNGKIIRYRDSSGREFNKIVACIDESQKGGLWLGTYEGGSGGIYFLDFNKKQIRLICTTKVYVACVHEDKFGLVWAGTDGGGLICYNQSDSSTTFYSNNPNDSLSIISNVIFAIHEDNSGTLWFGFDRFERSSSTFTHFSEMDFIKNSVVFSMLEDDHGNLWLNNLKGIAKFNPVTKEFRNYDASHGFEGIRFLGGVLCKTNNGEMYFGGLNGFVRFHPDSIRDNPFVPPIVITSFRKFDKPATFGRRIDLPYNENFISFEFAALSYISPGMNQYAYKLEGLDKDWIYSGTRRYASYPNLNPGEYTFRVKGSNNDGVWNEAGISIKISISPPWWNTLWAYIIYFGLFITGLYGLRRYELNRAAWKNQVKLDEAVLKEREETDRMKSRFFANISHEFRTPLTLIQGPVENIISKSYDEKILKDARFIKRNSTRLLQLINQLLDLSKSEAGKLKLEASKGNIVSFVKGVALSFESLSESKDITFRLLPEKEFIEIYFDKEKMLKVLTNLISNAFKFTPEEGEITIILSEIANKDKTGSVQIRIKDTGIGIPEEEIPKLFNRFYQVDSSYTREYEGTGIGLALAKELVEMHHGKITVESKKGIPELSQAGCTEFIIVLPMGRDHLKDEEIISTGGKHTEIKVNVDETQDLLTDSKSEESDQVSEDKTIILIVEDNYDMREYLKESLSNGDYLIEEAVNGEQGVRKAMETIPDLIISDIMMPKMDGNELTRIVKNDEKTSHIPIILLTAKSGQENKLEGLRTGADDYLTKPFDIKELQIRIENLITIRRKLQEKLGRPELIQKKEETKQLSRIDEEFMNRVMKVIEKHISDEEFSIEELGSEVGMSRTHLHRKLKALTGKSASLFLRSLRLTRAKKMIEDQKGNISEIAYSVGFSSPAYFTKCFHDEFGFPPSDLINR